MSQRRSLDAISMDDTLAMPAQRYAMSRPVSHLRLVLAFLGGAAAMMVVLLLASALFIGAVVLVIRLAGGVEVLSAARAIVFAVIAPYLVGSKACGILVGALIQFAVFVMGLIGAWRFVRVGRRAGASTLGLTFGVSAFVMLVMQAVAGEYAFRGSVMVWLAASVLFGAFALRPARREMRRTRA